MREHEERQGEEAGREVGERWGGGERESKERRGEVVEAMGGSAWHSNLLYRC